MGGRGECATAEELRPSDTRAASQAGGRDSTQYVSSTNQAQPKKKSRRHLYGGGLATLAFMALGAYIGAAFFDGHAVGLDNVVLELKQSAAAVAGAFVGAIVGGAIMAYWVIRQLDAALKPKVQNEGLNESVDD